MHPSLRRLRRAFTVIELLIAMSITVILAGILVSLTDGVLNIWGRTTGTLTLVNQSKLILDQVATDLQGLALRSNHTGVYLAATIQRDQAGTGDAAVANASWIAAAGGAMKPTAASGSLVIDENTRPEDLRFGMAGVWLRFLASEVDSNTGENNAVGLRAIAYQVVRHPVTTAAAGAADHRWLLYRTRSRVAQSGSGATDANRATIGSGLNVLAAQFTSTASGGTGIDDPGFIRTPSLPGAYDFFRLGSNVIDFGVRIYDRDQNGALRQRFPYDTVAGRQVWAFLATTNDTPVPSNPAVPPAPLAAGDIARGIPAVIEVIIRVATDEGARQIQNLEQGRIPVPAGFTADQYWWQIAGESSQVFVRRVEIATTPL